MTNKIFATLFLGLLFSSTFAQKINTSKLDSLFQILETKDKFMGSIAISKNGKLIYTKSIGKDDLEINKNSTIATKYRIGSISKMFTSCLIFKAIEEDKLNINQTIDKYFPTIENAKKITIGNLLNHRSGIHNFTNDEDYLKYNTEAKSEKQMLEIISKGKSNFEPDTKAEYSNSNYVLLSYILEKTYKKPFGEILNSKIIKPLGLKNTYFGEKINLKNNECFSYRFIEKWEKETETDLSIPMGAGAIVSNPTDLIIFIESLFSNKIITKKSLDQMTTIKDNYGMGIFQVPFHTKKAYEHNGGIEAFVSDLLYFPEDSLSIAFCTNGLAYPMKNILIGVLSICFQKDYTIPTFKTIELTTEELDKYLGDYSNADFPFTISITKENQKLYAQATGQGAFPLEATEKDKFEFLAAGIKLEFTPTEKQMIFSQGGKKFTLYKK